MANRFVAMKERVQEQETKEMRIDRLLVETNERIV